MTRLHYVAVTLAILLSPFALLAQASSESPQTLSLSNTAITLDQEFKAVPHWRQGAVQVNAPIRPLSDPSFSWAAGYIWDHPIVGERAGWPYPTTNFPAWTSNGAAEAEPNGDMITRMGPHLSPLTWSGTLNFTARKMPPELAGTVGKSDPNGYMGAAIISFPYAQRYGIFAMSAKLPKGNGIWPAFWLLPADKSWPPELDVMEMLGHTPNLLYTTVHFNGPQGHTFQAKTTDTHTDLSTGFHEYAVDWGPQRINWYLDRKLVYSQPTPDSLHKPCYILANLAVGKNPTGWAGAPDATTPLPATMQVAYIKVWQRDDYAGSQ